MKKIIVLALTGILAAGMLVSCGKFTCDLCSEDKVGKKYKEDFMGEEITICNDCHKELKELRDSVADLFG
ncbi:MAG: hypothetical protein IKI97_10200 [Clostridia bacterium]|nr:hypothetical protein [Clostridia bacterium]